MVRTLLYYEILDFEPKVLQITTGPQTIFFFFFFFEWQ